jgi:membrane protein
MARLATSIKRWAPVRTANVWAHRAIVPGTEGLSLAEILKVFIKGVRDNKLNVSCAAVTYNFVMAIPPTLLVLFSMVPYLPLKNVQDTILSTLRLVTPNDRVYISLSSLVIDFMNNEQTGVLSFGLLFTIFFASNGMMMLIRNFERNVPVYIKRTNLNKRWTAIKLTFLMIGVIILSLAVLIIQTEALNGLLLRIFENVVVIRITSIIIIIGLIFFAISVIYTYGPSLKHPFKFVSPGSVFATILSVIITTGFFFLINNFINYNKIYGSIGSLMAVMILIWLNTLVILLGHELNVSIRLAKKYREEIHFVEKI